MFFRRYGELGALRRQFIFLGVWYCVIKLMIVIVSVKVFIFTNVWKSLSPSAVYAKYVRIPCHVACTEAEGKEYIFGHPIPNRRQYYVLSVLLTDIPSDYFICDNFQTACAFTHAALAIPAQQSTTCLTEQGVVLRINAPPSHNAGWLTPKAISHAGRLRN